MTNEAILTDVQRAFFVEARRAVFATLDPDGLPRLVPICFVLSDDDPDGLPRLYTPLDEKPKRHADPMRLERVRDLLERPSVSVLVDRWDEDWAKLGWLRCHGTAELIEPDAPGAGAERAEAIAALREKHPQYVDHALESRPLIRVSILRASSWGALEAQPG
jgi:PPOX class probable F420-dependent enzyme